MYRLEKDQFNRDARFTIIEKIRNAEENEDAKKETILKRENFWIKRLQTLKPKGLNQELKTK